ncbi:hypothetical protein [Actinoplanes friuliensis]|uniref:Secreted protein n=1 Tax=Actinoplanes friuliensis DSM 7358 TaxID=1246995 RepID=U5VYD8_9ACTN|nr:hypothetical protein [Actinoplanes friuliensis]AGZ41904.1 secreted protein [Actinoplanes friuliensis DSM 7358]
MISGTPTAARSGALATLVSKGDIGAVLGVLESLDEPGRRALAAAVRALEVDRTQQPGASWHTEQRAARRQEGALRVAGAGCLPRAADIVSWLRSDRFWYEPTRQTIDALARILRAPGRPSLTAVAQGLATKLRTAQVDQQWPIVARLLTEAELPFPPTEAVLRGWIRELGAAPSLADAVHRDARTPLLLPHLFTEPGLGSELDDRWPPVLAGLSPGMLDGCLLRLHAGDRPAAIRPFVTLHRLLDPGLDECAARRQDYLGLLSSPHIAVAELAMTALRRLDEAGLLGTEALTEAARTVLPRPEKKLVRAQLAWLGDALGRGPVLPLLDAVTAGLSNDSIDLAESALKVLAQHLPESRTLLADAAAALEGDLRRQIDQLLDRETPAAAPAVTVLPPVAPSEPMPGPITTLGELRTAVKSLLLRDPDQPVLLERTYAALVAHAHADRAALARMLEPLIPGHWTSPFVNVLRAAAGQEWTEWQAEDWRKPTPPFWMLVARAHELSTQLSGDLPPALLATPATVDGHVDPLRVVTLLAGDWEPGPYDLSQALLRLPRTVDPAVQEAADRLTSAAGRAVARWLHDGGLPDPATSTITATLRPCTHLPPDADYECWCTEGPGLRRVATVAPVSHPALTVPDGLLDLPGGDAAYDRAHGLHHGTPMACWPMILPGHRDIMAAHIQPLIAEAANGTRRAGVDILPALADSSGPFGPATALCLAYGLAAGHPASRLAATDAFLILAATPTFDGALIGHELAALTTGGVVVLKRVSEALTEALRSGAAGAVWSTVRPLVESILVPPPPARAAEVLSLAAAAATAAGARGELPGLADVASRGGTSRLVTEAARLLRTLTP